MDKFKK